MTGSERGRRSQRADAFSAGDQHAAGRAAPSPLPALFLGGLFDEKERALVEGASRGPTQAAADVLQWGFVKGLESVPGLALSIVSAPFVGSYPTLFAHPTVETRPFEHGEPGQHRQVGFLNLPVLKHFSRAVSLGLAARRWALAHRDGGIALGYSLSFDMVFALAVARRINPSLVAAVIIPDLPEFMNTKEHPAPGYRILKGAESALARRLLSTLDATILLTEAMADRLPPKPYVVVEGIRPESPASGLEAGAEAPEVIALRGKRVVVYAGTTNTRYGVVELCRAFKKVQGDDLILAICGSGDGAEQIAVHASEDPRIRYLGQLPRSTVLQLERAATLLVNPRSNVEAFSAFSFPSKILEYMSTGVPVLCYKLGGIPSEYDSHLSYIPGDTPEEFAGALERMLGMDPAKLRSKGKAAQGFVDTEKNPEVQAGRVVSFLIEQGGHALNEVVVDGTKP